MLSDREVAGAELVITIRPSCSIMTIGRPAAAPSSRGMETLVLSPAGTGA